MKGAIVGDIVGSIYEWHNIKTKDFYILNDKCFFTDDTVCTVALASAFCDTPKDEIYRCGGELLNNFTTKLTNYCIAYPHRGYGGHFRRWIYDNNHAPYASWGNGAPMRASAAGWVARTKDEAVSLGALTAMPTHTHPEGIKAAVCVADLIFIARNIMAGGQASPEKCMNEMRRAAEGYGYELPVLDEVRDEYSFDVSSQGTMPVALSAFFESTSFEDAVRNAISVGGDSDTIAAVTGAIAEAYYGMPEDVWEFASAKLDRNLNEEVERFYKTFATDARVI